MPVPANDEHEPAPGPGRPLRVVVVADYPAGRAGLRALLEQASDVEVVGEVAPGTEPDVLEGVAAAVVDVAAYGRDTATELDESFPGAAMVLLTRGAAPPAALALPVRFGRAIVGADVSADELASAVAAAARGFIVLDPAFAGAFRDSPPTTSDEEYEALTPRELEVLEGMALGLPNKGIALRLHISEHTVKFHVGTILAKLVAASRTEAVMTAARRGMLRL